MSEELVSQVDFFASMKALTGAEMDAGKDSQNLLDALMGKGKGRESLIVEAKSRLAYRSGDYTLIPPYNGKNYRKSKRVELGNSPDYMLFNVKEDRKQKNDVSEQDKTVLERLKAEFHATVGDYYDVDITEKLNNK